MRLRDIIRQLLGSLGGGDSPPPPPPPPPTVPPPPPPPAPPPTSVSQQLLDAHNKVRLARGVGPLKINPVLGGVAQAHSDDQARHQNMSHTGSDGSSPFTRMQRAGYRYLSAGENVAMGYADVAAVMAGWMNSPGHRDNILRGYTQVGFGLAVDARGRRYWTALFATPSGSSAMFALGLDAIFPPGLADPSLTDEHPALADETTSGL